MRKYALRDLRFEEGSLSVSWSWGEVYVYIRMDWEMGVEIEGEEGDGKIERERRREGEEKVVNAVSVHYLGEQRKLVWGWSFLMRHWGPPQVPAHVTTYVPAPFFPLERHGTISVEVCRIPQWGGRSTG